MPQIIVNADDFGLTSGINRAIRELHQAGLVTSATLMAKARASEEAIEMARATPTLGVGCHIVLVDGDPVLSGVHDIPNVADPAFGRFETSLPAFLATIYRWGTPRKVQNQIEIETRAQIQLMQKAGLRLTHIDTHKHTHMFPRVLRPVLRAARSCGITTIRNPFEPAWAVRATTAAGPVRAAQVSMLRCLRPIWRRILNEEGFTTTDGTLAIAGTGALDSAAIRRLIDGLPAGTWELVAHPGYNDADLARARTRLRASRDIERQALAALNDFPNVDRVDFSFLHPDARASFQPRRA